MQNKVLQYLEPLTQAVGIANMEKEVFDIMNSHFKSLNYQVITDNLGSVFAVKKSKVAHAKKVMVAGHMDEVGFLVKAINKVGCLSIYPVGGWWSQTLMAQAVVVVNKKGEHFNGAIGSIPPHLLTDEIRDKPVKTEDLLVDIGATSQAEVVALGIEVGDMVVLKGEYVPLANHQRVMAKALDNRYGCALSMALAESLKDIDLPYDLYIGATVQEEVGLRGATTAASLINPDMAVVFDCSPANDATGDTEALGQLGKGVLLRFVDKSMMPNRCLLERLKQTCINHQLPYQYYLSLGGTDAGAIHKHDKGVATLTLCICARNIHTNHSIVDVGDIDAAYQAASAFLVELNQETINDMINCNQ